jgi:hemin uptake protein HemP
VKEEVTVIRTSSPPIPRNPPPRRIASTDLFAGRREIVIVHGVVEYRLRQTAQGKLILTK